MEDAMRGMLDPECVENVTGSAEVRQLFKFSKVGTIAGCYVLDGVIKSNSKVRIIRDSAVLYDGVINSIQREKDTVKEVLKDSKVRVEELTDTVFAHASDTKTPQGILCVVEQMNHEINELTSAKCPLIMVLDHLQDPGNLGTILRTAEGAGVTGILMDRECVDVYNPKTIRSTMGSIYRMPFVYVEDLGKGIQDLKDKGITTYAAHLEGTNSYDEEDLTNPCAFLIGNEGNGLRREIADMADCYVKIPMLGQVESLNAAIASSVLMFEAARQRRKV